MPKKATRNPYSLQEGLRRANELNSRLVDNLYLNNQLELENRSPVGFIAQTQCHANVLNLPQAKSGKSKVFWSFIVALAVTGLIIELFHVMTRYIRSPKASEINIESVQFIPFPAVVICNLNPINRTYLEEQNISISLSHHAQLVYALMKNVAGETKQNDTGQDEEINELLGNYPNRDLREFFYRAGVTCDEFLVGCSFQWQPFNCCEKVEEIFDIQFGKCFLVNSGNFKQYYPAAGLQIKVLVSRGIAAPSFGPQSRGLALRIMDHYDPSSTEYSFMGLGKHAALQIEQIQHHYLNTFMKTVCRDTHEAMGKFRQISNANYTYNQCIGLCFNSAAIKTCNCTYPQDVRIFGDKPPTRICTPAEARNCLLPKVENDPMVGACAGECLPYCSQVQYKVSTSSADLFSPDPAENEELRDTAVVDIQFPKIQTTTIREIYIVTADGLISQIGGLLGIFLGASLITAVQLIIFCVNSTMRLGKRCWASINKSPESSAPPSPKIDEPMSPSSQALMEVGQNGEVITSSAC